MRNLLLDPQALEDLKWWIQHDKRTALPPELLKALPPEAIQAWLADQEMKTRQ